MQFSKPRARALSLILIWMISAAALSACVTAPAVYQAANPCSDLIPDDWLAGVPSADLPPNKTAGAWVGFGEAQTGQLDKANGRTRDSVEIVRKCEARDKAAYEAL